jgi:DNA polymerase beta palm
VSHLVVTVFALIVRNSGRDTCGDIDILITRNTEDGFDHSGEWTARHALSHLTHSCVGILPRILAKLHAAGVIVADLGGESGDELEAKYMGICRLSPSNRARRIGETALLKLRGHVDLTTEPRHSLHSL